MQRLCPEFTAIVSATFTVLCAHSAEIVLHSSDREEIIQKAKNIGSAMNSKQA
jgi:hypothetical protein